MKKLTVLLTALILMGGTSQGLCDSGLGSDLINIQINYNTPIYNNNAVIGDATYKWNQVTDNGDFTNLKYADNGTSNVSLHLDSNALEKGLSAVSNKDHDLMNSYCRFIVDPADLTYGHFIDITGLSAGQYNVYVYSQGATNVAEQMQMSATGDGGLTSYDYSLSTSGNEASLIEGTNWQVQKIIVDSSGTINMTFTSDASIINGIQIQAVPEPGSIVLLGVGGVLALLQVRRKTDNDLVGY